MNDAELPRYKCHKEVHALKIQGVVRLLDGTATLTPTAPGYASFAVDEGYVKKHDPKVGGYYVVYDDGYESFSPAEAFEAGYTRL